PSTVTAGELRNFLAQFLFTGDDVYKHVRDLSGGEKGRLALAKLIYSRVNVLVLDEPTNHLDIPSREALEEALDTYDGTIITISHDRYFLDRIATQILALDGQGGAEHYDGDYTEYHDWKAARRVAATTAKAEQAKPTGATAKQSGPAVAQTGGRKAKTDGHKTGGRKTPTRTPEMIETEIARTEQRLATLTDELSRPEVARDAARVATLNDEYRTADERLRTLYEVWERSAAETARA
ncbi:MAG TPA: ATP-binding cassette domain-containing protein, partial [Pyrinomonadaceae bacterium]|nr:ATP-binding cassette domain-containing protein [Pyrinomonadaceae bacterium]